MTIYNNYIKFCYWNIGGKSVHGTNLMITFFIKEIQEFDVVIIAETHIGYYIPVFI